MGARPLHVSARLKLSMLPARLISDVAARVFALTYAGQSGREERDASCGIDLVCC